MPHSSVLGLLWVCQLLPLLCGDIQSWFSIGNDLACLPTSLGDLWGCLLAPSGGQ
jgi:hypothetical protein